MKDENPAGSRGGGAGPGRRAYDLLREVLKRPEDQRQEVLAGAPTEVAAQVDELLGREPEALLSTATTWFRRPSDEVAAPPPQIVGRYRILETLGEGGMGTVYLAEQTEPVVRRVALKVVRYAHPDRKEHIRFAAERQALARLTHPHIAQLYEAGETATGSPFFAMELVEGTSLITYADGARLDLEARLALFRQVCDGVAHAHRNGILHQDLKPANILVAEVDGRALPKVIDFGIAKVIDQPGMDVSLAGERPFGTPAYLSPEVVAGKNVDTRSDVYALGLVLYELTVGAHPFAERDDPIRMLSRILDEDPQRASDRWRALPASDRETLAEGRRASERHLLRRFRGDLDWILLKALDRDPDHRYGSVGELSADIDRTLHHEPLDARPSTLDYRLGRLIRRHRRAAVAAMLVAVSLVLGVVGTTGGMLRARDAEAEARVEALRANREAATASRVSDVLVDLFAVAEQTKGGASTTMELGELLERGAERIRKDLEEEPAIQARLMSVLGDIYRVVGEYEESREHLELALDLWEADPEPDPYRLGQTLNHLAVLDRRLGLDRDAESRLRRALELWEVDLGPDHPKIAGILNNLGNVYTRQGRLEEAGAVLERALGIWQGALGTDHRDVGIASLNLGNVWNQLERDDEALTLYHRAGEIFAAVFGNDHPHLAIVHGNLADSLSDLGRYEEAEAEVREATRIQRAALGPNHDATLAMTRDLGRILMLQGRIDEAEVLVSDAMTKLETVLGPDHPEIAYALTDLSHIRRAQGRPGEAVPLAERAVAILEGHDVEDDQENLLRAREELAMARTAVGPS